MKLKRAPMFAVMALCLVVQGAIARINYPIWEKTYSPRTGSDLRGLSGDQLLIALAGFREMVAGILWVRADTYFDEGNYDAILPVIRLVTMLDPKQIDVYATGMWHIAYNFTDEQSRSDRRYIPSALALGAEGARNNDYTYELFFETGWLWYHKIDDNYDNAVNWWKQASEIKDMQTARKNILAMALLRDGKLEEAVDHYQTLLDQAEIEFNKNSTEYQNRQNRDTIESNLDNTLVRMAQRGNFALKGGYYNEWKYDTNPPYDVGFSAQVVVEDSRVLRVEGTWNVQPVGTRVRITLRDADNPNGIPAGMKWDRSNTVDLDPEKDVTFMQDALFVKNQSFFKRIDMARDPVMYPFTTDKYYVEFYYNPRSAPPHIQDRFGFNGEGMTDSNFLNTDIRNGQRVVYCRLELTRDQLLRTGEWSTKTPVVKTTNFVPTGARNSEDIIDVPGMRSDTGN
ncbi:MAG: tetratricopeptide repeat protein [Fimbriimonadaceae bacterium]|nr:tetratricopeptide repeat protein [Fimbriimonadaceae bacterium]